MKWIVTCAANAAVHLPKFLPFVLTNCTQSLFVPECGLFLPSYTCFLVVLTAKRRLSSIVAWTQIEADRLDRGIMDSSKKMWTLIHQFQFYVHYLWAIVCRTKKWFTRLGGWYSQPGQQYLLHHFILQVAKNVFCMLNVRSIWMGAQMLVQVSGLVMQVLSVMAKSSCPWSTINWLNLTQKFKKWGPNTTKYCMWQKHKPRPATKRHTSTSQTTASATTMFICFFHVSHFPLQKTFQFPRMLDIPQKVNWISKN